MALPIMGIFIKNFKNNIMGEFVKIQQFTLVIIFVIFPQKCQFRLKIKGFEISPNSALYGIGYTYIDFVHKLTKR